MRSKVLCVSNILSTAYVIYLMVYFFSGIADSSGAEAVGRAFAAALVVPHIILFLIGAVFGWLGFILKKSWAALVCGNFIRGRHTVFSCIFYVRRSVTHTRFYRLFQTKKAEQ